MPYFVYKMESRPIKLLTRIESFAAFRDASAYAKEKRIGLAPDVQIKVIFAENELQAEDLLSTVRHAQITGDDD